MLRWRRQSAVLGVVLAGLVVLTSCGSGDEPESYGGEHRDAFVEDCATGGVSARTCGCFYDRVALEVPFERFVQLDEELREPRPAADLPPDIAAMAAGCAAQHQEADDG